MSENEATILGLDYIRVVTVADQLQSDVDTQLTIQIVDADDRKSPGSQIDVDYDATNVIITATDKDGNALVVNDGGTPILQGIVTVENGVKVISNFSVTVPGGPAASPILIKVEANLTEDAQKNITGRAYKPFGQVEKVVTATSSVFQVTAPGTITRGVAFNLVIQSLLNGSPDIAFDTHTGNVNINLLNKTDASDAISPTFTDNSAWSNGQKTVSVTVTGGSGSDTLTIEADHLASTRIGTTDIQVEDAAPTEIAHKETKVYSSFEIISGVNSTNWANVQTNSQAVFETDTTLERLPDGNQDEWLRWVERVGTGQVRARVKCGYMRFELNNPTNKTGVIAAKLKIRLHSVQIADLAGPFIYSPDANTRILKLKASTNIAEFTSGAALRAMTPDDTYNFTEINQKSIDAGAASPSALDPTLEILLDIKASVITGMTGGANDPLFVWFYIDSTSNVPFVSPWSDVDGKNPIELETVDRANHPSTTKLVLYK